MPEPHEDERPSAYPSSFGFDLPADTPWPKRFWLYAVGGLVHVGFAYAVPPIRPEVPGQHHEEGDPRP